MTAPVWDPGGAVQALTALHDPNLQLLDLGRNGEGPDHLGQAVRPVTPQEVPGTRVGDEVEQGTHVNVPIAGHGTAQHATISVRSSSQLEDANRVDTRQETACVHTHDTHLYPSRANAGTALGPSHTLPSTRGVKWTPRKGTLACVYVLGGDEPTGEHGMRVLLLGFLLR